MKHSPGPWETATYVNHDLQVVISVVKAGSRIHMMGHTEEDKANAKLIAAAPDLLETLSDCESLISSLIGTDLDQEGMMREQANQARAAIAKATGNAK